MKQWIAHSTQSKCNWRSFRGSFGCSGRHESGAHQQDMTKLCSNIIGRWFTPTFFMVLLRPPFVCGDASSDALYMSRRLSMLRNDVFDPLRCHSWKMIMQNSMHWTRSCPLFSFYIPFNGYVMAGLDLWTFFNWFCLLFPIFTTFSRSRSATPLSYPGTPPQHHPNDAIGASNYAANTANTGLSILPTGTQMKATEFPPRNYSDFIRNLAAKYNNNNPNEWVPTRPDFPAIHRIN